MGSRTFRINIKGISSLLTPLFVIIITTNLIGLIPYVFSSTSHLLFTLSFRLAANISAGHIVLTLLGAYTITAILSSPSRFIFLFPTEILYILFEIGICLIQAYIFCLLLSLYSDDHPISYK